MKENEPLNQAKVQADFVKRTEQLLALHRERATVRDGL